MRFEVSLVHLTSFRSRKTIRALAKASAAALISVALLAPAAAQFWNPFGGPAPAAARAATATAAAIQSVRRLLRRRAGARRSQPKADYSSAPPAARRTPESSAAITSPILVLGDAMADWLAYGLEDAFSERPEFGVVRKHRTYAGLVRYDRGATWNGRRSCARRSRRTSRSSS